MKKSLYPTLILSALFSVTYVSTLQADEPTTEGDAAAEVVDENCQAPKWAIAIGHEDKWKLHNGCAETAEPVDEKSTDKKPEVAQ